MFLCVLVFSFIQLSEYYAMKEAENKRIQAEEQNKIDVLSQELSKQAVIDLERVEYRRLVSEKRKLDQENRKKQELTDSEEKKKKIEKFLESVKPEVQADPTRFMKFTKVIFFSLVL